MDDTIITLGLPGWSPSIKTISLAILILSETFSLSCATYSAILEVRIWTTLRAVILPVTALLFMWFIRRVFSVEQRKESRIGLKNKAKSRCELNWRLGSAWVQMKAQKMNHKIIPTWGRKPAKGVGMAVAYKSRWLPCVQKQSPGEGLCEPSWGNIPSKWGFGATLAKENLGRVATVFTADPIMGWIV